MHMKKRSVQVIQACNNLVHFDTMQFCKLTQEEHLCQLKHLCQIPTVDDHKHTVMDYFSLLFFDFILLTVNFDGCVSCLQEMFPCCLLLPR